MVFDKILEKICEIHKTIFSIYLLPLSVCICYNIENVLSHEHNIYRRRVPSFFFPFCFLFPLVYHSCFQTLIPTLNWACLCGELQSTRRRQLTDVKNRVETSASWSSIQYNLLEVKHTEK